MAAAVAAVVAAVTPAAARHLPAAAAAVAVIEAAAAEVATRPQPIHPLQIRPQHSLATGQRTVPPDVSHWAIMLSAREFSDCSADDFWRFTV